MPNDAMQPEQRMLAGKAGKDQARIKYGADDSRRMHPGMSAARIGIDDTASGFTASRVTADRFTAGVTQQRVWLLLLAPPRTAAQQAPPFRQGEGGEQYPR